MDVPPRAPETGGEVLEKGNLSSEAIPAIRAEHERLVRESAEHGGIPRSAFDRVLETRRRYLASMGTHVRTLGSLIDDLFELSRIRSGGLALSLQQVDARDLVADVMSGSAAVATAGGVALDAAVDPASLRIDAGGMNRVLANLVINAIRHTPSDGAVRVVGRLLAGEVVLSVSDGCGGIAPEQAVVIGEEIVLVVHGLFLRKL